jgi:hypothetical protein
VVGRGCSPGAVAPPRLDRVRRVAEEPMRSRSPFLLIRPFASDTINRKGQESIFCQLIFEVLSDNENAQKSTQIAATHVAYRRAIYGPGGLGRVMAYMRPVPPKLRAKTMIQGALKLELSAASFPSIAVQVARKHHFAYMYGLILSGAVRQDQLRRIFEDPSSRLDKSTGSPIPTSFGFT